jgi:hypothetical protein
MYPFFVFSLPHDASDSEVEARYGALVRACPPERASHAFAAVCAAHDHLRDASARLRARLFYFDDSGRALVHAYPAWLRARPRRRLTPAELAALVRGGAADEP